jgi:cation diffusion facilitator family transporter
MGPVTEGSRRAIFAAFLANLGIAIAKLAAWSATGAASMLAESVHSLADSSNQGLLLLGAARARREPTPEHPFGYGRERYFWAFVVAVVLFTLGGLFAAFEGIEKLRHPHELASPGWAVGVLLLAIALEGWSLRTAVREANKVRRTGSWWSFVRRAKSPELPVVLLEDLGALLGLVFALLGVSLAVIFDEPRFDALGSVVIGALLGTIAVVLAIEMKSLLIGESASPADRGAIVGAIESTSGVTRIIHLRTQHIGPEELLVGAKVELDADLDFPAVARTIDALERSVRERVPMARVIYVEPDVHRGARPGEEEE